MQSNPSDRQPTPVSQNHNLIALLLILLIIGGAILYALKFRKKTTPEEIIQEPVPKIEEIFDVEGFIESRISGGMGGGLFGQSGASLESSNHYPEIKTVKFRYLVSSIGRNKKSKEKFLLKKYCNNKDWQKVLQDSYKLTHAYHLRNGNKLVYTFTVTSAKCTHRDYPGKNLEDWTGNYKGKDIRFKSFGPSESKSEVIVVR